MTPARPPNPTQPFKPLALPKLSLGEAQAINKVACAPSKMVLTAWPSAPSLEGMAPPPALSLRPGGAATPWAARGTPEDWRRLHLNWSGGRLLTDLPLLLLQSWASARLGGVNLHTLPPAWREVAWTEACQHLVEALTSAGRGPAHSLGLAPTDGRPPEGHWHALQWTLDWPDGTSLSGPLWADAMGLLLLAGLLPAAAAAADMRSQTAWAALPMPMRLTLGETDLPLARLRALQSGDVIFLQRCYLNGEHRVQLQCSQPGYPGWRFDALLAPSGITLLTPPMPHNDRPDNATETTDDHETGLLSLDQLLVRLSFDVGDKTLTLAELQALQPGQVLPLDHAVTDYVKVRANGALIGHGHLVEIDGRLGVSLARLVHTGRSPDTEPTP